MNPPQFMVDVNVGKLARWLRAMGYDAVLFRHRDDNQMVRQALAEGRVILTKDGEISQRRVVANGQLRVLHITSDEVMAQLHQVVKTLSLNSHHRPFTRCLECNLPLEPRQKEAVRELVPPYVFRTQQDFSQCPGCGRIYWQGTHWEAISRRLKALAQE